MKKNGDMWYGPEVAYNEAKNDDDESHWGLLQIKRHIPNIVRYIALKTPWLHLYVHNIFAPDPGRHVHNHPWWGFAFVLWGGYVEEVRDAASPSRRRFRSVRRWTFNTLPADKYHTIAWVRPNTWTVLIGGPRRGRWGFLVDGKHIDSADYIRRFRSAS